MKKFFISCILLLSTFFTYGQTITSTIEFVVNTDSIIENESFNNFTNQVLPYVSNHKEEVTYVLITGSASPEGSKDRNVELATKRAKKLESFLEDMIPKERMISQIVETPQADVKHYPKLRSATVEIHLVQRDTIYKKIVFENTIRDTVIQFSLPTTTTLSATPVWSATTFYGLPGDANFNFIVVKLSYIYNGVTSYDVRVPIKLPAGGLQAGKYYKYEIKIQSTGNGTNDPNEAANEKDEILIEGLHPIVVDLQVDDYNQGTNQQIKI